MPPASFSDSAAPRAPCRTRGSPLPHPAITVPMRYSSNRQKVLRFCGAMVSPGPTLSASGAAASPDQPFRPREAASRRGLSLAGPRRQVASPFLSCHFPGAPEPASSQAWANRRRGHHTRPPPCSQSARYTSPPRRRGQPVRQQKCSRGRRPMGRGNVRGSRRPEAPENRRELRAEKERGAVGNRNVHQSRGSFPDQLLERGLPVATSLETTPCAHVTRAGSPMCNPRRCQSTWGVLPRDRLSLSKLITVSLL